MFTKWDREWVDKRFDRIERMLRTLMKTVVTEGESEMASIQELKDSVQSQTTVIEGASALLDGINQQLEDVKAQLAAEGVDTAALDEVMSGIKSNTDALSAAVARNTDADDEVHAAGM